MKLVRESLDEKLSPSGAVYGFAGWLTTRDKSKAVTMSACHDAAVVAELVDEFITKQDLEQPEDHWEDDLIGMSDGNYIDANFISGYDIKESKSDDNDYENVKEKVEKSKKLSAEMKTKIIPLIIKNGIHGTRYNVGIVFNLKYPKSNGCSLGADKDGFFVMTHRARSKSYPEIEKIPQSAIKFIESTG